MSTTIRPGTPSDHPFIERTATEVFAAFGDYRTILPDWLSSDGVVTTIAEEEGRPVGFTLVGFYRTEEDPRAWAADLLAIGVVPEAQGRGVGKLLLDAAVETTRAARRRLSLRELRLSVADTNARARHLFARAGFELVQGDFGLYDGGQRALRMRKKL